MPVKKSQVQVKTKSLKPDLNEFKMEVEQRAHDIFIARTKKGMPGDSLSDWLAAESEIKAKYKI